MNIEIRNDSVVISGYVNAVERWSKPIRGRLRGAVQRFIEKIKAGTFKNALKRNDNVKVLLNHDPERELASTQNGTAILEEDNIGLRAEVTITDPEVVEKARNHKLIGWSFGFYPNSEEISQNEKIVTRTVTDMDLVEVSILDDTKSPAYYGTSIEARCEGERVPEYRASTDEFEAESQEDATDESEAEKKASEIEYLADLIARKVLEKLKPAKETDTKDEPGEAEERTIDYSAYEKRLSKIKFKPEQ
nr:MAG TPA: prohead serine protease [Caudoviricetes sp.]